MPTPADVDAYIEAAPPNARSQLRELRDLVHRAAPDATELMRYDMPTYDLRGQRFLNFAAATRHIAVYGLVHVDGPVPPDLASHLDNRSTLKFRLGQPLPSAALEAAMRDKAKRIES